jgi:hypothetical protein
MHLRQFLNEINGRLEIQHIWLPKINSSHDIPIMKSFLKHTNIRVGRLKSSKQLASLLQNYILFRDMSLVRQNSTINISKL